MVVLLREPLLERSLLDGGCVSAGAGEAGVGSGLTELSAGGTDTSVLSSPADSPAQEKKCSYSGTGTVYIHMYITIHIKHNAVDTCTCTVHVEFTCRIP